MGGVSSTLSVCFGYCAYSSASSLCNACFGSTAPSASGRRRSVLLLGLCVCLSLAFQYWLAPAIVGDGGNGAWKAYKSLPGIGKYTHNAWKDGCDEYYIDGGKGDEIDPAALAQCAGNAGAYRPAFISFLFFAASAIATRTRPSLNRRAWPAKYGLYLACCLISVLLPNRPLFSSFFVPVARMGAAAFIVVQQVILVDVAYNWNERWVGKADAADRIEWGSGAKWLKITLAACAALYAAALVGIGVLLHYFGGNSGEDGEEGEKCGANRAVVIMTLLGVLAVTALQLSGTEGSLLTSGVISLYVTYLAYASVSKNPRDECNPQLGKDGDAFDIVVGLLLTGVSLGWTGWSWTAGERLQSQESVQAARAVGGAGRQGGGGGFARGSDALIDLDDPFLDYHDSDEPPSGVALESARDYSDHDLEDVLGAGSSAGSEIWKLNAVLALVSCWVAMSLTGWGSISGVSVDGGGGGDEEVHSAANPQVGWVNMAMICASQWTALGLYAWTLAAPRLFPDRDFS